MRSRINDPHRNRALVRAVPRDHRVRVLVAVVDVMIAPQEKPSLAPFSGVDGKVFTYRAVVRGGHVMHLWSLADEKGGIHVSASLTEWQSGGREWMGGAETHYAAAPDYMNPDKPSHEHCWVLGKPCWHDGSSLYFSENIAHMLPPAWSEAPNRMEQHHHDFVLSELRYLYRLRFEEESG